MTNEKCVTLRTLEWATRSFMEVSWFERPHHDTFLIFITGT